MRVAIEEAERTRGWSSPNPPVGAVVVRDGQIVGRGYTLPVGREHAEVVALRAAGEAARGATVYCTLEPCSHHGRTPPCTAALIEAAVVAVHYAVSDPDERAAGGAARTGWRCGPIALAPTSDVAPMTSTMTVKYFSGGASSEGRERESARFAP